MQCICTLNILQEKNINILRFLNWPEYLIELPCQWSSFTDVSLVPARKYANSLVHDYLEPEKLYMIHLRAECSIWIRNEKLVEFCMASETQIAVQTSPGIYYPASLTRMYIVFRERMWLLKLQMTQTSLEYFSFRHYFQFTISFQRTINI